MTAPDQEPGRPFELWELMARESVRHTLASYHFAGDRGRLDELAACFQADGSLEVVGQEPLLGRDGIRDGLGRMVTARRRPTPPVVPAEPTRTDEPSTADAAPAPAPVGYIRHHLATPHFRSVTPTEIHTSTYFAALTAVGVDHWGRYADVLTPDADGRWLLARRVVTVDGHAPASQFGP